ncbi:MULTISPECIES: STAS domain-containing protein [unclassified Paracoccus (in: a-proteobacteria)]|uniref:STAS domain-containing protein n=1 Tax=unclassified Paracoccus (in: a-proteobacteria) TaxID=2688777 RepID=UPI0018A6CB19|nr:MULTISPECIES: STAS domain-containing protein [unclassified Paracoccus (in: a-proteobacteria)]UXU76125.1 STAS domain-containing protein [Paracoccus sp. SMMA_5]UXU82037.1 STAS domain-containing protein [Paracoccus sp. SMMA_5_TC]
MHMTLLTHTDGITLRVEEKRLDAAIAIAFKDKVRAMMGDSGPQVVLDLSQVDFMDSSGLGAVIALFKAMPPGRQLVLAGLTPNVQRVFELTRMDKVFTITDRAPDALPQAEEPQ